MTVPIYVSSLVSPASAGIAQLVEHNLAKVGVAGSSPVSRSREEGSSVLTDGPFAVMTTFAGLLPLSFSETVVKKIATGTRGWRDFFETEAAHPAMSRSNSHALSRLSFWAMG